MFNWPPWIPQVWNPRRPAPTLSGASRVRPPWKTVVYHRYPKLAIVCKTFNQFIIAFQAHRGPEPDVDELKSLLAQTRRRVGVKVLVADASYDSESNHEFARQVIGARTVIPAKHGRPTDQPARGRYRRPMRTRFDQPTYRQRAQVETTLSTIKRRQGHHVRGRTYWSQTRELRLIVLTHNVMIGHDPLVRYTFIQSRKGPRFFPLPCSPSGPAAPLTPS